MHSVLTINGGSSSIKFALYEEDGPLARRLYEKIDRIGLSGTNLTFNDATGNQQDSRSLAASDHKSAAEFLIDWLEEQNSFESVRAVGHRVVHGMKHIAPGLLGVSEISSDMRDLLEHETRDVRAAEAVALFCYQIKKWVGAFAAALGGVDTLVFAGGIGENAPLVRARICEGLSFLGIELNESRNAESAEVISTDASRATVRVIRTDEELMIALSVCRILGAGTVNKKD